MKIKSPCHNCGSRWVNGNTSCHSYCRLYKTFKEKDWEEKQKAFPAYVEEHRGGVSWSNTRRKEALRKKK